MRWYQPPDLLALICTYDACGGLHSGANDFGKLWVFRPNFENS